jgi:glutamate/tyrosine decarboxylase-like PLP-dependent enzyme
VTDAREVIEQGVTQLGFHVLGEPKLGLIAFSHPKYDIFAIYKQMYKRGWFTSLTTEPKALHLMLSPFHAEVTDAYLSDLRDALQAVAAGDKDAVTEVRYS